MTTGIAASTATLPAPPAGVTPAVVFYELENNPDLHEPVSWEGADVTVRNVRTGETLTVDQAVLYPYMTAVAA